MYRKVSGSWLKHWDFILLDLVCLQMAYAFSVMARNGWMNPYGNSTYMSVALVIVLADICTVFFTESYRGIIRRGYFREFQRVLQHVATVYALELVFLFLTKRSAEFSRISFVIFAVSALLFVYVERVMWKEYLRCRRKVFYRRTAMLLVTTLEQASQMVDTVQKNAYNELEIVGLVLADRPDLAGGQVKHVPVVCALEEIPDYIQTRWVDSLLVHVPGSTLFPQRLTETCIRMGVTVHTYVAEAEGGEADQQLERLAGYVVLTSNLRMVSSGQLLMKRLLDICGGLVGLVMAVLAGIVVGPLIFLNSPGPILFSQTRVGRNGRRFKIYKFRSMYLDAEKRKAELLEKKEANGLLFKLDADPRIIGSGPDGTHHGIGWFIRRTSIDEFPQFWNVLKGEMSLVGTRPPTIDEWERYAPHHRARMAIKPGLTGLWQVSGRSNITDFEEVVRLDVKYIQNWNIGVDIKILLKTVQVVLAGEGAK